MAGLRPAAPLGLTALRNRKTASQTYATAEVIKAVQLCPMLEIIYNRIYNKTQTGFGTFAAEPCFMTLRTLQLA